MDAEQQRKQLDDELDQYWQAIAITNEDFQRLQKETGDLTSVLGKVVLEHGRITVLKTDHFSISLNYERLEGADDKYRYRGLTKREYLFLCDQIRQNASVNAAPTSETATAADDEPFFNYDVAADP